MNELVEENKIKAATRVAVFNFLSLFKVVGIKLNIYYLYSTVHSTLLIFEINFDTLFKNVLEIWLFFFMFLLKKIYNVKFGLLTVQILF